MTHFQLFAWLVRKMGKKSKLFIQQIQKPILNDQVGSGSCAHTKFSSATSAKVVEGKKCPEKLIFRK